MKHNIYNINLVEDEGVCVSICETGEVDSVESLKIVQGLLLLVLTAEESVAFVQGAQERQVLDHGRQVGGKRLLLKRQSHPRPAISDLRLDLMDGGHIVHDGKNMLIIFLTLWARR